MINLENYKKRLKEVCCEYNIKKLDIFGSAVTSEFGPDSDIDILIEFNDVQNINLFDKYFELKDELQEIFNRPVDILIEHSIKNPFLIEKLNSTRVNIYAA